MSSKGFFFDPNEIAGKRIIQHSSLEEDPCQFCGMFKGVTSPRMKPYGKGKKKILIIGEAPGQNEDEYGIPFVGRSGKLLSRVLEQFEINIDEDCLRTNVLQCRPKNNVFDESRVEFCYHRLEQQIFEFKPKLILCFGQKASRRILETKNVSIPGLSGKADNFGNVRGDIFPFRKYMSWVALNYHPAAILRRADWEPQFVRDLERALYHVKIAFPRSLLEYGENILCDEKTALETLSRRVKKEVSIDFETNHLNQFASDFKLVIVSISFDGVIGYVIPLLNAQKNMFLALKSFIQENTINCHKFDEVCCRTVLGTGIKKWQTDIMISGHILDERRDKKSLGFQAFEETGDEYKNIVDRTEFGKVTTITKNEIIYSSLDARFPVIISERHWKELRYQDLTGAMEFFMKGNSALAALEENGVLISEKEFNRFKTEVNVKRVEAGKFLQSSSVVARYKKHYGSSPSIQSSLDMKRLFFDLYKIKPLSYTERNSPQVNDTFFDSIEKKGGDLGEFCKYAQLKKSLEKLSGTYIESITKYIDADWFLHPTYNLWIPRTYRSSCDSPNLQNVPKRNDYLKNFRKMFIPTNDFFLEADYKGAEVTIQAILAQDKNLLKQLNEGFDAHRYWGSRLYSARENDVTKLQRFNAKNKFVFPEFYGASGNNLAPELGLPVRKVMEIEKEFYDMYYGIQRWQQRMVRDYEEQGFVKIPTGFIRRFPLTYMQIVNTPVQGTTFHCLLDTLIKLLLPGKYNLKKLGFQSLPVLQVHDSILFDTVKEEENDLKKVVNEATADKFHWPWYKGTTLQIEWQKGNDWLNMKEV